MNLLPKTEKVILKKGLRARFLVVALFMMASSFFAGFILLLPSYFLTQGYFTKVQSENDYKTTESEERDKLILNLPEELDSKLKIFQAHTDNALVSDSLDKVIGYLPPEVKLNSISFSRSSPKDKNSTLILISGRASQRESLVSFSALLKDSNSFSSVEMPVSSLTRDKDLPFSMNIFIKNPSPK